VGVEVIPLIFSKALHVTELTLDEPQIALVLSASGKWNFSSLGGNAAKSAPSNQGTSSESNPNLSVKKLNVKNGRLTLGGSRTSAKPHTYDDVNITVNNFSFTSQFPFTLSAKLPGGGKLNLDGNAGPVNPTDSSATPLDAKINVKGLDLQQSGFVDPCSGIAGIADFEGSLTSDGKMIHSSGTVRADKLKLAEKALLQISRSTSNMQSITIFKKNQGRYVRQISPWARHWLNSPAFTSRRATPRF